MHPIINITLTAAALLAQVLAPQTFTNPAAHLAFQYPPTLQLEDPGNQDNYSYRTRFALHPDSDPEHKGADPCSPLLLAVGMGPDQPLDPAHKAKAGKQVPIQPTGGLTLNEIKHSCLAQDSFNAPDDKSVADLVENVRHIEGSKPIARTLTYQVQGAQVLFAASSPADPSRHSTAGFSATAAALINGRIFLWSFTANDLGVLNRMLASKVCFDAPACKYGYTPLVPYTLTPNGEAKPSAP